MEESYFIDVFNLIRSRESSAPRREGEIQALLYRLEKYVASRGSRAVAVFDGTRFEGFFQSSGTLEFSFSNPGETADARIESLMHAVQPKERIHWTLVSDDGALRNMARGFGVRVVGTGEFLRQAERASGESAVRPPAGPETFYRPFEGKI